MAALGPVAAVSLSDPDAMLALAEREGVTLTIVGPELPLSVGVVDRFVEAGRPILGPVARGRAHRDQQGLGKAVHGPAPRADRPLRRSPRRPRSRSRRSAAERLGWPLVIKADGLAAGKGVVLVNDAGEAMAVIDEMLTGTRFGEAGRRIVLEECLVGPEVSFFVLTRRPPGDADWLGAGSQARARRRPRPEHRRHGRVCAEPAADARARGAGAARTVVHPVLAGMREEGHPYRGFLYCGLMLTAQGPMVIEFNARLGDPEAQVILPLIDEPLLPLLDAAAAGALPDRPARLSHQPRVGVVMASGGYPGPLRHRQAHHRPCRRPPRSKGSRSTTPGTTLAMTARSSPAAGAC